MLVKRPTRSVSCTTLRPCRWANGNESDNRRCGCRRPMCRPRRAILFYRRLNQLLREHGFDDFVEAQCTGFFAEIMGRPGLLLGMSIASALPLHPGTSPKSVRSIANLAGSRPEGAGTPCVLLSQTGRDLAQIRGMRQLMFAGPSTTVLPRHRPSTLAIAAAVHVVLFALLVVVKTRPVSVASAGSPGIAAYVADATGAPTPKAAAPRKTAPATPAAKAAPKDDHASAGSAAEST